MKSENLFDEQMYNDKLSALIPGRGGMMMGPRGHGFHPYGPPRGAMRGQRGAFMSYPGVLI